MNPRNWKYARMDAVAVVTMVAFGALFYLMGVKPGARDAGTARHSPVAGSAAAVQRGRGRRPRSRR